MQNIIIGPSSIDVFEEFLSYSYSIGLIYDFDELLTKFKGKHNYIQNKNDESHQALWFGPLDYKYGKFKTLHKEPMTKELINLAEIIELNTGYPKGYFNSVYINCYENAGIGYHHDNDSIFKNSKEWEDGKDIVVAVYSLGDSSKISMATRDKKLLTSIDANNNSLYIMNKNFQNNLLHQVGKTKGQRISFTFRNCII